MVGKCILCIVTLSIWMNLTYGGPSVQLEQTMPIPLRSYRGPKKLIYGRVSVPRYSSQTTFDLRFGSSGNCKIPETLWCFAHNRYPFINFLNGSHPSDVNMLANDLQFVTNSSDVTVTVTNPSFGDWFWVVTINQKYQESMKQAGFGGESVCRFRAMILVTNTVEEEPKSLVLNTDTKANISFESSVVYRFQPSPNLLSVRLQIKSCKSLDTIYDNASCPINVTYSNNRIPKVGDTKSALSRDSNWIWKGLRQDDLNFVRITNLHKKSWLEVTVQVIPLHECATIDSVNADGPVQGNCMITSPLNKFVFFLSRFHYFFSEMDSNGMNSWMFAKLDENRLILPYHIRSGEDIGGTLQFGLNSLPIKDSDVEVRVYGCLSETLHFGDFGDPCVARLNSSSIDPVRVRVFLPYPRIGVSYLNLWRECFLNNVSIICPNTSVVAFTLLSRPCIENTCGAYGTCTLVEARDISLGACQCRWGYTGFSCSDDKHKVSFSVELVKVLCLTVSNAFFIPAVIMAIKRRFYVQSLVYLYIIIFSTLYHMCDSDTPFSTCVMDFETLSFCDFYGAVMAIWVTLISMSGMSRGLSEIITMAAALTIVIGILTNKHSLYAFLIPLLIGATVVLGCWARQWYLHRKLYPQRRWWIMGMLPGAMCATCGLILFSFYQTNTNYAYVHSAWHVLIALAILFVLPWTPGPRLWKWGHFLPWKHRQNVCEVERNESNIFDSDRVSMHLSRMQQDSCNLQVKKRKPRVNNQEEDNIPEVA